MPFQFINPENYEVAAIKERELQSRGYIKQSHNNPYDLKPFQYVLYESSTGTEQSFEGGGKKLTLAWL